MSRHSLSTWLRCQNPPPPRRRRVTDVPAENVQWFTDWTDAGSPMARELARAELTAQRDGYVIRWAHPWACQLLGPLKESDHPEDGGELIDSVRYLYLDGAPDADHHAREIESQILRRAGLDAQHAQRSGYAFRWEQVWTCQLYEPDGATLIGQSYGWSVGPDDDPAHSRWVAADLLLAEGV
jgi:hypothetical protein